MALKLDNLLSAESIPLISVVIGVGVVSFLLARACGSSSPARSQQEAPEKPPTEDKSKPKKKKKKKKASAKQETSDEEEQDVKVNKKESKKEDKKTDKKTAPQSPTEPVKEDKKQQLSKAQARRKRLKAKKAGDEIRKVEQDLQEKNLAAAKKAQEKATQQRVEKLIQQQKKAIDEDGYQQAPTRRSTGRVLRPSKDNEQLSTSRFKKEPEPVRETTSVTLAVPTKSLGLIIGKEGKTIKEIQARTKTQILTPKEKKSEGYEVSIKITGDIEGVGLAKQAINDLLTKGFSTIIDPASASGTVFLQDERQIGILIGPDGSVIKKFQKTLGVNIKMPSPGDRKLAVVISGTKEAVKEARQSMHDLLELGYSKILDPTWTHVEVPFPPAFHGRLIGTNGQNLKSILGNTGCRVNIPKAGSDKKDFVTIVGPISKMESAKKQVLRWAEEREEEPAPADPYDPFGEEEEENYDNEW